MRRPFVAGNWKMYKTVAEATAFVREIRFALNQIEHIDSAVCPPFVAIPAVAEALAATRIGVGAQNMHEAANGAYTGECAPGMLTPYCRYVILGHSERRAYFGETDEGVNRKTVAALQHGLTPIICVGETLAQNEAGQTHAVVSGQVQAALAGLSAEQVSAVVFAYEPIWAIGTGKSAEAAEAGRIIGISVRGVLADLYGEDVAQMVRIQYGGSVNEKNIADYLRHPDIDGALVGGASLKPAFVQLVANAAAAKRG